MLESRANLSKSGFLYLVDLLESGSFSKSSLRMAFQSFLSPVNLNDSANSKIFSDRLGRKRAHRRVKISRKLSQIGGLISLISVLPEHDEIIDLCAGNGAFSAELARTFSNTNVKGVDNNSDLMIKATLSYQSFPNLSFQAADLLSYEFDTNRRAGLVVSLHGCGGLIDRAIDISVNSGADFVGVPCCYSKISQNNPSLSLPRSRALSDRTDKYSRIVKIAAGFEGLVSSGEPKCTDALADILRLLVNFDRVLYLQQNGYRTAVVPITDRFVSVQEGKKHINSPHRYALVGLKN